MDVADVFKGDVHAGRLRRMTDHIEFAYDPGYLRAGGRGVASTLPAREEPYRTPGGAVPAFFAGLLPDGARLQAIIQGAKTSADDEMSLLLVVAGDTVGDMTVVPVGERPRDPGDASGVQAMAASCAFRVMPFRVVHDRLGESGLLVERFDRVTEAGRVSRIPQEDACQLSGRWPADKYRNSMRSVVDVVASVVSAPKAAIL